MKSFCQPDLTWTKKPVCNPVKCISPMLVPYSSVKFKIHDTKEGGLTTKTHLNIDYAFTYGEQIYYECDHGYHDIKKSEIPIVCDVREPGSLIGQWSNEFPTCQPVKCFEPLLNFV